MTGGNIQLDLADANHFGWREPGDVAHEHLAAWNRVIHCQRGELLPTRPDDSHHFAIYEQAQIRLVGAHSDQGSTLGVAALGPDEGPDPQRRTVRLSHGATAGRVRTGSQSRVSQSEVLLIKAAEQTALQQTIEEPFGGGCVGAH
jgi:hypothetical protein